MEHENEAGHVPQMEESGPLTASANADRCLPVFRQMGGQATMQMALPADLGILSYQWHMLQENAVPGLLPLSCFEEGGQVRLCWRVSSLQPLSMLFSRRTWTVAEMLRLFRQVYVLLSRMDNLLLDAERLLLDSNHILIDPVGLSLHFAYCPLLEVGERPDAVRELLLSWLNGMCRLSGKDDAGRLSSLLLLLHEPSFHWSLLSRLFADMQEAGIPMQQETAADAPPLRTIPASTPDMGMGTVDRKTKLPLQAGDMRKETSGNPYAANQTAATPLVTPPSATSPAAPGALQHTSARHPSLARILLVQVIVVGCLTAVLSGGILTGQGRDANMARAGMLLFAVALEVWGFLGGQAAQISPQMPGDAGAPVHRPSSGLGAAAVNAGVSRMVVPSDWRAEHGIARQRDDRVDKAGVFPSPEDTAVCSHVLETGLLRPEQGPCLVFQHGDGQRQSMPLTKYPFLIGRLREQVDGWLEHPTVGKMHAEIRMENGHPVLVDLNSRNGTKINGAALVPYVPVRLHSNDHIRISAQEIVFLES